MCVGEWTFGAWVPMSKVRLEIHIVWTLNIIHYYYKHYHFLINMSQMYISLEY